MPLGLWNRRTAVGTAAAVVAVVSLAAGIRVAGPGPDGGAPLRFNPFESTRSLQAALLPEPEPVAAVPAAVEGGGAGDAAAVAAPGAPAGTAGDGKGASDSSGTGSGTGGDPGDGDDGGQPDDRSILEELLGQPVPAPLPLG